MINDNSLSIMLGSKKIQGRYCGECVLTDTEASRGLIDYKPLFYQSYQILQRIFAR